MNYLAHFQLSHGNEGLMIGALLGDFVKGPLKGEYPQSWEHGITLHRRIDAYTDSHSLTKSAQALLAKKYRRFSGIMLDVAFDHFLNIHWQRFHPQTLPAFIHDTYQLLSKYKLPQAAQRQADNLIKYDVLTHYQDWNTVDVALGKIGERLRVENPLASSAEELKKYYPQLEQIFLEFYPHIQQHVSQQRKKLILETVNSNQLTASLYARLSDS